MKVLIAADMEGITGVVDWKQVDSTHAEYQRFRRLMTQEVNAAAAGAVEAGVDEIIVADGHGDANNILIEELHPRARLNSGTPSPLAMVQGVDSGVVAAFFIGYHAHMGAGKAVLAHTWSSRLVSNVWLNGKIVGEIGLNAAVCASFGLPVLLLTGDQAACQEALEWVPGIEVVEVKKAASRSAAECLPPTVTHPLIQHAAARAIKRFHGHPNDLLKVDLPVKVTIEFLNPGMADRAALLPIISRIDGRKVELSAEDMPSAYRLARSAISLARD
ncbi:MAG: M55 family metallopeptidase [Anaerolineales bacterium]|nr:M55 family metallopeptidase [Anaerolineales bacterium]